MKNELKQNLAVLKSDLYTLHKISINQEHINDILQANQIAKDLNITTEESYCSYRLYLEQLVGVDFLELTSFDRFKDYEYYSEVRRLYQEFINMEKQTNLASYKIIPFPKKRL